MIAEDSIGSSITVAAGIATAIIGLLTAVLSYRLSRAEFKAKQAEKNGDRVQIVSMSERRQPSLRRRLFLKWLSLGAACLALLYALALVFVLPKEPLLGTLGLLFFGLSVWASIHNFLVLSRDPMNARSRVRHSTVLEVLGAKTELVAKCHVAMAKCGWRTVVLDADKGVVEAEVPMGLLSGASLVTVRITRADRGKSRLEISSEPTSVMVIYDWGINRRRVRKFIAALM